MGLNPLGDQDSPPSSKPPAVSRPEFTWEKTVHRQGTKGGRQSPLTKYDWQGLVWLLWPHFVLL